MDLSYEQLCIMINKPRQLAERSLISRQMVSNYIKKGIKTNDRENLVLRSNLVVFILSGKNSNSDKLDSQYWEKLDKNFVASRQIGMFADNVIGWNTVYCNSSYIRKYLSSTFAKLRHTKGKFQNHLFINDFIFFLVSSMLKLSCSLKF